MGFSALLAERQHYGITPEPDKKSIVSFLGEPPF
jgi:hypothetical protein